MRVYMNDIKFFISGSFNSEKKNKLDCDILKVKINDENILKLLNVLSLLENTGFKI